MAKKSRIRRSLRRFPNTRNELGHRFGRELVGELPGTLGWTTVESNVKWIMQVVVIILLDLGVHDMFVSRYLIDMVGQTIDA